MHLLQEPFLTFAVADLGLQHPGLGVEEELKDKYSNCIFSNFEVSRWWLGGFNMSKKTWKRKQTIGGNRTTTTGEKNNVYSSIIFCVFFVDLIYLAFVI